MGAPYAERDDPDPGPADRTLATAWSWMEARPLARLRRRALAQVADAAIARTPGIQALSDARFRAEAAALREELVHDGMRPWHVATAFALVREASRRNLGLQHHRVQLMGGAAMLGRALAEMDTGEGKTITALLPAALFALAGRPVHVVTVNDYLAQRDADQLKPVYAALGLRVGTVVSNQERPARRAAYRADVAYCTNKDLVFDYLRDRMALGLRRSAPRRQVDTLLGGGTEALLLRGLHVAIVDEADSVLIDEARTPLILSGPDGGEDTATLYETALDLARRLGPGADFDVDWERRTLALNPHGGERLAQLAAGLPGVWAARRAREELVRQALSALTFFARDTQYVVAEGKIQIVDEYTGRIMPDRTWEHGLHQMIEAKEACAISGRRRTIARMTYQRFFRRYGHLCGMTGTAAEARGEMGAVYGLRVVRVPTHHPSRRQHRGIRIMGHERLKWADVVQDAADAAGAGQAVLVGTRSVGASEHVAALLTEAGLRPAVLNAQQNREEAAIIARAGQPGCVTVATNMAGRGTDIRLSKAVREHGGLHVILTEFHESARIDRQLFGRCGRQGDPGSTQVIVALDDEMFRRFGTPLLLRLAAQLAASGAVPPWLARLLVRRAQARAERMNAATRRQTVREDARLEKALAFAGQGE